MEKTTISSGLNSIGYKFLSLVMFQEGSLCRLSRTEASLGASSSIGKVWPVLVDLFYRYFFLFLEARFGVYECAKEVPLHRQKCPHTGVITNSPVLFLPSVIKLLF